MTKTTRGFILTLVVAYLTLVGADDLQEINCKGKTNDSFRDYKLMYLMLNKENGKPLLGYINVLFILNKSSNELLNIKSKELNNITSCL